jgi:hypothetical protein
VTDAKLNQLRAAMLRADTAERAKLSVHEAGHAVVAARLGCRVKGIKLREGKGAVFFQTPQPAPGAPNRVLALTCYAGALAVERFTGSPQRAADDLAQAVEAAHGRFLVPLREESRRLVGAHWPEILDTAAELYARGPSVSMPAADFLKLRERRGERSSES